MKLLIKNARLIDPSTNTDEVLDVLIENSKIIQIARGIKNNSNKIIDAKDKIILPGFIDMHAHLREPGREDEETILSGSRAAAKGGFTSICAMPNTDPSCDNQGVAGFIISEGKKHKLCNVFPIGAITKGRNGQELSEMTELKTSGCLGVSDDGVSVTNAGLMRRALEYADMLNLLVICHCEDSSLSQEGVMHEGFVSTLLGLRGIPSMAETSIVIRDIQLSQMTGARIHIAHVSTKESVELIRQAKKKGIRLTCEAAPHHFSLTDEDVKNFNTNTKVNPPLRTKEDVAAIKKGLQDGTIDVVATDHAPHTEDEKDVEFDSAPFGMIGLESALSVSIAELINAKALDWFGLSRKLSLNPANILGLKNKGRLIVGADADIVVIDPKKEWTFTKKEIVSKSKNSPYIGRKLKGAAAYTICAGRVSYKSAD